MHQRIRIIVPVLLLLALVGGGYWWWRGRTASGVGGALTGTGTIEAEQVLVTAEVSGRVKQLFADEGQEVALNAPLVQLDTALLDAQRAQAAAAVKAAEANLALLQAGARPEELTQAEAQLAQAQAQREGAAQQADRAQQNVSNPQELNAQVAQLQGSRDAARAALDRLRAPARAEDVAAAQAALDQADAALQAARDRLSAAKTQAETQLAQAASALTAAQARYAQAKSNWETAQETGNDPLVPVIYNQQTGKKLRDNKLTDAGLEAYYAAFVQAEAATRSAEEAVRLADVAADAARKAEVSGIQTAEAQQRAAAALLAKIEGGAAPADIAQAQTQLAAAQRTLDVISGTRAAPQGLQGAADAAQTQLSVADAQVSQAAARLALLRSGTRAEQIQAAEAQLAQAQAALQTVDVQLTKAALAAPRAGLVLSRPVHEGEQATPGTALLTIGALDTVRLVVYIPEGDIGRVRQGQAVRVTVDSFPGRTFDGRVTFIAGAAQFTPRNVQTVDERKTTVFAVRVELPNADRALKPGMPADAVVVE